MITTSFGETHFGGCDLGHRSRNQCLVKIAELIHRYPGGTLPHKLHAPHDYKAMDRLVNRPETTHAAVLAGHYKWTREQMCLIDGPVLILHDTTELDYSGLHSIADLGSIGGDLGRGYLCHNSLAYDPQRREVIGLANQILHTRTLVGRHEPVATKRERLSRESRLWTRGADAIPMPPDGKLWVHVADRGADTFEYVAKQMAKGRHFVTRAVGRRKVYLGHNEATGKPRLLKDYADGLPLFDSQVIDVAAHPCHPARKARIGVAFAPVQLRPPHVRRGDYVNEPLRVWLVVVRELNPPKGTAPIDWMLLTDVPVETRADAWVRVEWYKCRWVVEEYHKGQKTGCSIEDLQFTSMQALEPMIGLLSVVAVTLLKLRDASRDPVAATRPATDYVDSRYVAILAGWRYKGKRSTLTVKEFFLALARLGGHQNRKGDSLPGWVVLWRGWQSMQHMLTGAEAMGFGIRGDT